MPKLNKDTGEITESNPFTKVDLPFFKTPYNHDREAESDRTALLCNDQSLTKQEFKEETDINTILNRFLKTGEPPPMALPEHFDDLSGRRTYFEMQTQLAEANARFYTLPASTRADFANQPAQWADEVVLRLEKGDVEGLRDIGFDIELKEPQKAAPAPAGAANGGTGGTPAPEPPKGP